MLVSGVFFFQAEDGIRDLVRSRGLGDVYKRQLGEVIAGADVFVGLSAGGVLKPEMVARMAARPLILSLIHI